MEMNEQVNNAQPVLDPFLLSEAAEHAIKLSGITPIPQAVALFPSASVTTHITVENRTNRALIKPITHINAGEIPILPQNINPGTRGSMVATDTNWISGGSSGIVTWLMHTKRRNLEKRLIIMWHTPYYRIFNNWLGLGEADDTVAIDLQTWYKALYNNTKTPGLDFEIGKFCWNTNELRFDKGTQVVVDGMMGTGKQSNIHVVVSPKDTCDYSKDILDYIRKKENNAGDN